MRIFYTLAGDYKGKSYTLRLLILTILLCNICFSQTVLGEVERVYINYYSEIIPIDYNTNIIVPLRDGISEESFRKYYYELERANYHSVLGTLFKYKKSLNLNDWLFYLLIRQSTEQIFPDKSENYRTLFCWFMLDKSGYKAQLNYVNDEVLLSVFTLNKIYDMPVSKYGDGWFVDLTAYHRSAINKRVNALSFNFEPSPTGKPFSFSLETLPTFTNPEIEIKKMAFVHDNELQTLHLNLNKSIIHLMYKYPELSIKQHAEIPLSPEAQTSLLGQLSKLVKDKTPYEATRLLLSFTRQAMNYKTDKAAYKVRNLTFSSEETLYYKYSDCEDRSILFHFLIKELLNLHVILVDYPEHATTAVLFEKPYGDKPILHKNKQYTICDPTGPGNHLRPGQYPQGLLEEHYNILNE